MELLAEIPDDLVSSICAFCLTTSPGAMMAHETSSAAADARLLTIGWGSRMRDAFRPRASSGADRVDLTASYVVKKAPAPGNVNGRHLW